MAELRHHIQRHILTYLISNRTQRYSQLRPAGVEPNQFVYHLKQLIREGLVQKNGDEGYALTEKGRSYADKFDPATFAVPWEVQPRSVLFLAVYDAGKGWLLERRDAQPTIGKVGFITCNPELGSSITTTAGNFLRTQFGLSAQFTYAGSGSVTLRQDGYIESYVIFQLVTTNHATGALKSSKASWYSDQDLHSPDVIPSTYPILAQLYPSNSKNSFVELTLDTTTQAPPRAILPA